MKLMPQILVLLGLLSACGNSSNIEKYGTQYNDHRKSIGLPALDPGWTLTEDSKSLMTWLNPHPSKAKAYHFSKAIILDADGPVVEQDKYIGSNKYTTIDGTYHEELLIMYHFKDHKFDAEPHLKGWECVFRKGADSGFVYEPISHDSAIALLRSWAISFDSHLPPHSFTFPTRDAPTPAFATPTELNTPPAPSVSL